VTQVIGYIRCSTREQADSGAGLAAQRAAIQSEADRRGWTVRWVEDPGESGKTMDRPGMHSALRELGRPRRNREVSALVVAKLDRISRSVQDFAQLLGTARRQRWAVVALDLGVDTSTSTGRLVAHVLASVAEWERDAISQRTRDALAAKKAAGVRLGRERMTDAATVSRIQRLARRGHSPAHIARTLDAAAVPTPNGGQRWYPSTVARLLAAELRTAS
jgi:DNA invertase Pin-like site-specific DNA recombinase